MFISKKHLPRRTFLKGLGATVALPLLDAMVPAFAAIVQGRNRLALGEIAVPVLVGAAAAALAVWGHETISGGTPLF